MIVRTNWELPLSSCDTETAKWLLTFVSGFQVTEPESIEFDHSTGHRAVVAVTTGRVKFYTTSPEHETMLKLRFDKNIHCTGQISHHPLCDM